MLNNKKTIWFIIGGAFVLALAVGAVALASTSVASAQEAAFGRVASAPITDIALGGDSDGGFAHRGGGRFPGGGAGDSTYLAEALGISVEELEAAYEAAGEKALDQALEEGLITEEMAEAMKERGHGFPAMGSKRGGMRGEDAAIDFEALLADELGISVEELQAAHEKAAELATQARIDSGELTQEQVDLMQARQALMGYLDRDAQLAEALDISVEELQAAREEGKSITDLIDESGLSTEEFQEAMQAAHQAALEQAIADGVITQDQADQLQSGPGFGHGAFPGPRGCPEGMPEFDGEKPFPGRGGRGGFERFPGSPDDTLTPDSDA